MKRVSFSSLYQVSVRRLQFAPGCLRTRATHNMEQGEKGTISISGKLEDHQLPQTTAWMETSGKSY